MFYHVLFVGMIIDIIGYPIEKLIIPISLPEMAGIETMSQLGVLALSTMRLMKCLRG